MILNVEALQELESTEQAGLDGCPILGSCCPITYPPIPPTFATCFGNTFG